MSEVGLVLVGLAIGVGLFGVVLPVLPGAVLVWAAIAAWAVAVHEPLGWAVLAVATLAIASTQVLKYLVPARALDGLGIPLVSVVVGVAAAIAGFFLIPVVGLFLGFPLGIFAAEWLRLRSHRRAWESTRGALKYMGVSILIELTGALLAAGVWLAVVIVTA
jgi:uncharacterized protein YqgC (DUF456 family)